MKVEVVATGGNIAEVRIDDRTAFVPYIVQGNRVSFQLDGQTYVVDVEEKASRARRRHRDHSMSAPMPGVVLKILTAQGQRVTKGTPLLILEAMKMENVLAAEIAGTVSEVHVKPGDMVEPGKLLVLIVPKQ